MKRLFVFILFVALLLGALAYFRSESGQQPSRADGPPPEISTGVNAQLIVGPWLGGDYTDNYLETPFKVYDIRTVFNPDGTGTRKATMQMQIEALDKELSDFTLTRDINWIITEDAETEYDTLTETVVSTNIKADFPSDSTDIMAKMIQMDMRKQKRDPVTTSKILKNVKRMLVLDRGEDLVVTLKRPQPASSSSTQSTEAQLTEAQNTDDAAKPKKILDK